MIVTQWGLQKRRGVPPNSLISAGLYLGFLVIRVPWRDRYVGAEDRKGKACSVKRARLPS